MKRDLDRRIAVLEARRRPKSDARHILLMPWDLEPDLGPDDMAITINFVRPTDQYGGERVPYIRTGIHPAEDDPESHNGRLHHDETRDRAWITRTYATGTTISLPHNGREPLAGVSYA